jgi:hypothetical protein
MKWLARWTMMPIGLGLLLAVSGCFPVFVDEPSAPRGQGGKYEYYYYRDSGVYYDHDRNVYFYPDGGHWRESSTLPSNIHVDKGRHEVLRMDEDRPYVRHDEVIKKYPPGRNQKMDRDDKRRD